MWIQSPGEQGNSDQGHPCSTRCSWQQSSCCLLWCSFPRAQHCRVVLAGHGLVAFSPKQPALLGPAQQHLDTPRTTQISQPGASHHPYPLHLHFSSHPWPWGAENLTVPTQDIQPGLLTPAGIWCLESADQHLHCCTTHIQLWWLTGNHKMFATSTNREQQLQMVFTCSPMEAQMKPWSSLESEIAAIAQNIP